jgi:hypothetical protein
MDTPCIEWPHWRTPDGYGRTVIGGRGGRNWLAHRWTWTQTNGPIPDGLHVLHHCDNRGCINVDHLFLGTNADNVADRVAKGRTRVGSHPGELNPSAKLTGEQVDAIRADPRLQYVIAAEYGVSKMTISEVKRRITWAHR